MKNESAVTPLGRPALAILRGLFFKPYFTSFLPARYERKLKRQAAITPDTIKTNDPKIKKEISPTPSKKRKAPKRLNSFKKIALIKSKIKNIVAARTNTAK